MFDLLKELKKVPESPGVYRLFDEQGDVVFVARSGNIKQAIRDHLTNQKSRTNKLIAAHVRTIEFEVIENKLDATRRELDLIRTHHPAFNGRKRGLKQYRFIKVFDGETFPRARKKKFTEEDDTTILGPFPKSRHIQVALSLAANHYRIADCGKEVVLGDDHKIVKTCIRRQTKQCMRPCELEVDQERYNSAVEGFKAFFRGEDRSPVDHLKARMNEAVKKQEFERAAKLRDDLESVKKIGLYRT